MLKKLAVLLSLIACVFFSINIASAESNNQTDLIGQATKKGIIQDFAQIKYRITLSTQATIDYMVKHQMYLDPNTLHCKYGMSPSLTGWSQIDFLATKSIWLIVKISDSPLYQYLVFKSGEVCGNFSNWFENPTNPDSNIEKGMEQGVIIGNQQARRFNIVIECDFCLELMKTYGLSIQGENLYLAQNKKLILLNQDGQTMIVRLRGNFESVFIEVIKPSEKVVYFVSYGNLVEEMKLSP